MRFRRGVPIRPILDQGGTGNGSFGAEGAEVKVAVDCTVLAVSVRTSWQLFLRQRMQVAHQTFQALLDYVGIDLRGRDIGVAEQGLDDAQIGARVEQVTCKSMTQHMRADQPRRKTRGDRQFLQVAREMLPRQMSAFAKGWKQPVRAGCVRD